MPDFLSLIIFASFLWLAVEMVSERRQIKGLEVFQKQAIEQFRSYQTQSTTVFLNFIGSEAEIIRSKEDIVYEQGFVSSYSITIFAINQHCENFMFVSNQDGPPFFKHVSHVNAKIVLGEDYREPD